MRRALATALVAAGLGLAAGGTLAQYKVVAPDGSVTYTDRPQAGTAGGRITPLGRSGVPLAPAERPLPLELRTISARFPVTLYTMADCTPCDAGRQLLRQRGIPFAERTVANDDDTVALQRLTGARNLPALIVGQQVQRGLQDAEWQSVLDLAGYPKESRLPRDWPAPVATPLAPRAPVPPPVAAAPAEPAPAEPPLPPPPPPSPTGSKFRF